MANINDYLIWRGDLRISKIRPFNDVDAIILARFAYLIFYRIKMDKVETVRSIAEKMEPFSADDFLWPDDKELIENLGRSKRFRNLRVTDYVRKNDQEIAKQFSAITIHLNHHELFISYLGTDESLFGWREDFNMAFMEQVPAQEEALRYLRRIVRKYPWKKLRLGGHSKGGNVAMYAAVLASDPIQLRINKVYNLDGPGLSKTLARRDSGLSVLSKIQSFIPQESFIGRLFEHAENVEVIKSTAAGFYQHDIYSWEILGTSPVKATITQKSDKTDRAISNWLASATDDQKRIFIDVLFEIASQNNIRNPRDFADNWLKFLPGVIKSYRSVSKEDRRVVAEMVKKLRAAYSEAGKATTGKKPKKPEKFEKPADSTADKKN